MSLPYDKNNISLAKTLRNNETKWERHLWYDFLADYPIRFQRQKAIDSYIADFYCHEAGLVIELDGRYHLEHETSQSDLVRQEALNAMGLFVLRFSNAQIDKSFLSVCKAIDRAVKERIEDLEEQNRSNK